MHPTLGVNDIADAVIGAADGVAGLVQILFEGLDVGGIGQQKLHVVAAGEAEKATAVFVGQVREQPDGMHA